ncbi:uncharacterized protein LOC143035090 [Oratosquilla oratoria]|uniref:uncharacterized protein LOC143035090 n=1 Tax=Oratosquilla oratoria TaxID=337810 RepID=UPI003F75965A
MYQITSSLQTKLQHFEENLPIIDAGKTKMMKPERENCLPQDDDKETLVTIINKQNEVLNLLMKLYQTSISTNGRCAQMNERNTTNVTGECNDSEDEAHSGTSISSNGKSAQMDERNTTNISGDCNDFEDGVNSETPQENNENLNEVLPKTPSNIPEETPLFKGFIQRQSEPSIDTYLKTCTTYLQNHNITALSEQISFIIHNIDPNQGDARHVARALLQRQWSSLQEFKSYLLDHYQRHDEKYLLYRQVLHMKRQPGEVFQKAYISGLAFKIDRLVPNDESVRDVFLYKLSQMVPSAALSQSCLRKCHLEDIVHEVIMYIERNPQEDKEFISSLDTKDINKNLTTVATKRESDDVKQKTNIVQDQVSAIQEIKANLTSLSQPKSYEAALPQDDYVKENSANQTIQAKLVILGTTSNSTNTNAEQEKGTVIPPVEVISRAEDTAHNNREITKIKSNLIVKGDQNTNKKAHQSKRNTNEFNAVSTNIRNASAAGTSFRTNKTAYKKKKNTKYCTKCKQGGHNRKDCNYAKNISGDPYSFWLSTYEYDNCAYIYGGQNDSKKHQGYYEQRKRYDNGGKETVVYGKK